MSDSKKLSVGKELTDDELMEMTGGHRFRKMHCKHFSFKPEIPTAKYGIQPDLVVKYGVAPDLIVKYGVQPLYGVQPEARTLYGIEPY